MMTVAAAAEHARVCETLVRGWIRDGLLAHSRVGSKGSRGKIMIALEDLDALLASFKVGASEPKKPAGKTVFKYLRLK